MAIFFAFVAGAPYFDEQPAGAPAERIRAADAAAERLHALYGEELERVLAPPVHPMVDERQTRALIRMAHAAGPGVCEAPDATAWIWSDLHLGHKLSLARHNR